MYCWGSGARGQLGTGSMLQSRKPTHVATLQGAHVIDVSARGDYCACVAYDGNVYAWGSARHVHRLATAAAATAKPPSDGEQEAAGGGGDGDGDEDSGDGDDSDNLGADAVEHDERPVLKPTPLPAFGGDDWVTQVQCGRDHCAFLVGGAWRSCCGGKSCSCVMAVSAKPTCVWCASHCMCSCARGSDAGDSLR